MPLTAEQNSRRSFDVLLHYALSRGVPFADAQDLVQASLVAALEGYDAAKGAYLGYCTTILGNRIKNYWRDRKSSQPIEDVDIPDPDLKEHMEKEEEMARMKKMIDRISSELTPEESAFLKALGIACEELESRAVSKAARSLGLEPEKGWDVFRRIQRKARALFPAMAVGKMLKSAPRTSSAEEPSVSELHEFIPHFEKIVEIPRADRFEAPVKRERVYLSLHPPESHDTIMALARWVASEESFLH
ncbi:MAG TPA: sigma factor, partial [Bacteroidota bacterium]|nr:sigma factor [Bacteroidota bacterium]